MVIHYGKNDEYDEQSCCPVCNSNNDISNEDMINYQVCECKTKCTKCYHENYWAYGHFVEPYTTVVKPEVKEND